MVKCAGGLVPVGVVTVTSKRPTSRIGAASVAVGCPDGAVNTIRVPPSVDANPGTEIPAKVITFPVSAKPVPTTVIRVPGGPLSGSSRVITGADDGTGVCASGRAHAKSRLNPIKMPTRIPNSSIASPMLARKPMPL